ncbi:BaiN/RdsA family NAD(P)/FAD-dependent oxidoreductase [Sapientia aquatica]|uniref:NAD(P)/FAD-dependent oxidoreductase n=1 Tax=Sapientia aquatica TaxID=1549640 RepID=A0A4R5W1X3_9BURK|nr:NAD(P)/FAD-dependent oxidoreductase [Sapientia aquatica]TDK66365.1 NAD(P)/FAD-dependent oxidoreductase [Sapientia aquatica]
MVKQVDVIVIGAGAAGLMCAAVAGQRGKSVMLIDHASVLAEKIRISGGGRCNFTNLHTTPQNYLSENPHFCKSALARYTPQDFLSLIKRYGIAYHEKHKGQLFCDHSAEQIISMLKSECEVGGVEINMPCKVTSLSKSIDHFVIHTDQGEIRAASVVIATGGLSIPKIGATDFAYRIAQQFDIPMIAPTPALVPLTFDATSWQAFVPLAGIALEVEIETGTKKQRGYFREDLLFTHRGLSGPGVLQISSYWKEGEPITINLLPEVELAEQLIHEKSTSKKNLGNVLAHYLPSRLAEGWLEVGAYKADQRIADMQDKALRALGDSINNWKITPNGSEGYRKAEVTRGGVDTKALSQQTMMVNKVPGLYFIGEAIDVTGWLGGYNFQWAWASGVAAGQAV